jgi:secreted trypsin-like serine protease
MRLAPLFFLGVVPLLVNVDATLRGKVTHQRNRSDPPLDAATRSAEKPIEDGAGTVVEPITILPFLDPSSSLMFGAPVYLDGNENIFDRTARIVGGSTASSTEAPFFAMMLTWNDSDGVWTNMGCGGTVVSDRHILTAAHCFQGRSGQMDAAFVSAYEPFEGNARVPFHFSRVKSFSIHPSFRDEIHASDIAVLTLQNPIQDTASFPPVRLLQPQQDVVDGQTTKIYGFGQLSEDDTTPVDKLQVAKIPYISNSECKQYYSSSLLPDMICGGYPDLPAGKVRRDSCAGDSGGPMTITGDDGLVYQIGIVSWGEGCGQSRKPGVYTSVQYHFEWIQNTVCNSKGVDHSIDLCLHSSTCTSRKQGGDSCNYGGECCSGTCNASFYSGKRVCQSIFADATTKQSQGNGG